MRIELDGIVWKFISESVEEFDQFELAFWKGIKNYRCGNCGNGLSSRYSLVIGQLDKAGLLPDDYRHLCCLCYFLDKVHLLHLKMDFKYWDRKDGIATIQFWLGEGNVMEVRVHDYERVILQ